MKISTLLITLLAMTFSIVVSLSTVAQADSVKISPDAVEFKVILKNALFASGARDKGIEKFKAYINSQPETEVNEKKKEKSRIVSYLDTKKCDLFNNNYILRKRFELKNGIPDRLKLTLKYRGTDPELVGRKSFQATPSAELTKSKYEADIVAKSPSQTERKLSYSGSIELGKIKRISDLLTLYPVINELGIDEDRKLKTVRDFTAFETKVKLGNIEIAGQKCKASFTFWYESREKTHPIVSEFSYVCSQFTDEAQKLYMAIIGQRDWVEDNSTTKTAIAYGNYCNG